MAYAVVKPDAMVTGFVHDRRQEILIDSEADLTNFTEENTEPGSIAYTADMAKIFQMSPGGEWVSISL